jgi:hypothetical protein
LPRFDWPKSQFPPQRTWPKESKGKQYQNRPEAPTEANSGSHLVEKSAAQYMSFLDFLLLDLRTNAHSKTIYGQDLKIKMVFPHGVTKNFKSDATWKRSKITANPTTSSNWSDFFRSCFPTWLRELPFVIDDQKEEVSANDLKINISSLTPKNMRPLAETMLRDLQPMDPEQLGTKITLFKGESKGWLQQSHLDTFAMGAQHTSKTVEKYYLLPSYDLEMAQDLIDMLDAVARNWSVDGSGNVRATQAVQDKLNKVRGPQLEEMSAEVKLQHDQDLLEIVELQPWEMTEIQDEIRARGRRE